MMPAPKQTEIQGFFGGGNHPQVPVTIKIIDLSIPEGHHVIGGKLYRETFDWKELQRIVYVDGSKPTACALVPVRDSGEGVGPVRG